MFDDDDDIPEEGNERQSWNEVPDDASDMEDAMEEMAADAITSQLKPNADLTRIIGDHAVSNSLNVIEVVASCAVAVNSLLAASATGATAQGIGLGLDLKEGEAYVADLYRIATDAFSAEKPFNELKAKLDAGATPEDMEALAKKLEAQMDAIKELTENPPEPPSGTDTSQN